jgi:uncharacterized protein (TIGR02118 family)
MLELTDRTGAWVEYYEGNVPQGTRSRPWESGLSLLARFSGMSTGVTVNELAINEMIKRISLVWKRPHLSDAEFRRIWLGEHVQYARKIPGVREYTIDFVTEGPAGAPSGVATLRFDDKGALEKAFSDPQLNEDLRRTREEFAKKVQVVIVDENLVIPRTRTDIL